MIIDYIYDFGDYYNFFLCDTSKIKDKILCAINYEGDIKCKSFKILDYDKSGLKYDANDFDITV